MQRSLLLLVLSSLLVGCQSAGSGSTPVTSAPRFSWEKENQPVVAPDASRARIIAIREDLSLLELVREVKVEPNTRLQLTKEGKSFLVQVIQSNDNSMIVAIVPNQASVPVLHAGEDLPSAVVAAP